MIETIEELFNECTVNENGCWVWNGKKNKTNYGCISFKGKQILIHRLSWSLKNGEIPKGMLICHHCDNPPCCNPDHLFLGTNMDNVRDCINKGRAYRKHVQIEDIVKDKTGLMLEHENSTWRDLERKYNISFGTLNAYANGRPIKNKEHRRIFGLPVFAEAPVCPTCGIVHVKKCPAGKTKTKLTEKDKRELVIKRLEKIIAECEKYDIDILERLG